MSNKYLEAKARYFATYLYYALMPSKTSKADVSCGAYGLKFDLNCRLHPYCVYMSSGGSGESTLMHKHAGVCVAPHFNNYEQFIC